MGDDFRNVGDDKLMNPAKWNAKTDAEIAAMSTGAQDRWQAMYGDGSGNPDNDPEFPDFVPPNGGSSDAPIIYDVQPTSGPPGTQVTLIGIRFLGHGNIQPPNTLEFNNLVPGRSASFSIMSDTVIKCTVPDGAIDGRIALHSYNPTVPADVITLSVQSFHPTSGSVPPPPPSPPDPSLKVHWDAFDVASGPGPILHGAISIHGSQPIENLIVDSIIGQAGSGAPSGLPIGFYAYTHHEFNGVGTDKTNVLLNTDVFGVGRVNPPPKLKLQGDAYVQATFKIGTKIKRVRKKVRVRIKRPYLGGVKIIDGDGFQVVITPPALNPIPEFWNEKKFASGNVTVVVTEGTLVGGSFDLALHSANGSSQKNNFNLPAGPGNSGISAWETANLENNFGTLDFWATEVSNGKITIKGADGVTRTHPFAGQASSILLASHGGALSHGAFAI